MPSHLETEENSISIKTLIKTPHDLTEEVKTFIDIMNTDVFPYSSIQQSAKRMIN